ncbi:hypothetical protein GCM10009603_58380 [Nocardiopsis exhalans]
MTVTVKRWSMALYETATDPDRPDSGWGVRLEGPVSTVDTGAARALLGAFPLRVLLAVFVRGP